MLYQKIQNLQTFPIDCNKFIICYKDYQTSASLDVIFFFGVSILLGLIVHIMNKRLERRIKEKKVDKKDFYDGDKRDRWK